MSAGIRSVLPPVPRLLLLGRQLRPATRGNAEAKPQKARYLWSDAEGGARPTSAETDGCHAGPLLEDQCSHGSTIGRNRPAGNPPEATLSSALLRKDPSQTALDPDSPICTTVSTVPPHRPRTSTTA